MTSVVRFSPALGDWIRERLDRGSPPHELVQTMVEQQMPAHAAQAIAAAFMLARGANTPYPVDSVLLADEPMPVAGPAHADAPGYRYDTPRLRPGTTIDAGDRLVRIAARAERPALAVLAGVTSAAECEELIEMARPRLTPSTLVDPSSGRDVVTGLRTSLGMFFRPGENALVARLGRRFAELMSLPPEHGEGLQILHYREGAGSAPHFDFLVPGNPSNRASIERSGQRVSTLVAYLNDVPAGGETLFPAVGWAVSPQRGNAVYFEYANRFGELDHASLHASNAVQRGEKWVATQWMRARPFVSARDAP